MNFHNSRFAAFLFAASLCLGEQKSLPPNVAAALRSISASELKGDLSFLASDALEGRYTPSPGLHVAAEFIASRFRAAGLEPDGNQQYFQIASMVDRRLPNVQSGMLVDDGKQTFTVPAASITVLNESGAAKIANAPVIAVRAMDPELLKGVDLAGKAIVVFQPEFDRMPEKQAAARFERVHAFKSAVASSQAAIEIEVGHQKPWGSNARLITAEAAKAERVPSIVVVSEQFRNWAEHPAAKGENRTISLDLPPPQDDKVALKNVAGILRGSDPKLNDTCVLLTAHYDHIGTTETGARMAMHRTQPANDHIYNGANDDGSGTVSVIQIAQALARLTPRPKRTIVFVTFFGEERGDIGSHYYAEHPIFPLAKTIADINLEQVGRTDSTTGKHVNSASLTGYDYSDVPKFIEEAGRETGIRIYVDKEASDAYFTRSDNAALAEQGVPAHTLTVAFDYPDYHGLGDEWPKIDYDNMARVDRMVALSLLRIADSPKDPAWNATNQKTVSFRQARQKSTQLQGGR